MIKTGALQINDG